MVAGIRKKTRVGPSDRRRPGSRDRRLISAPVRLYVILVLTLFGMETGQYKEADDGKWMLRFI
ncbi:hypothetical protein J21TS3_42410 [Paenibacillus cookii]|uniref:Uncharacterized protein n=1 Tax=Paenibacillus cookii TaxID=157839 RepID=A0ABQ4M1J9_9BACL|nr:hypothetical protein J21TS3_42410 [Paenibacillus cookii]